MLNSKYSFDLFVVGSSNKLAYAAALSVAESPAASYNPLFIHGGVGLGKTHLMQAIGNHILQNNPDAEVCYISSEKFVHELINSIRDDKTEKFRDKYRNRDVLLVDDIQFLAGKERTQEEFFHTFNALFEANKQIVISSSEPPKNIPVLAESLRSRFEGGLMVDIQPPDLETRVSFLAQKAESQKLQVPNEVITYLAEQFSSSIRELEGVLFRLKFYASQIQNPITLDLACEAVQEHLT